MIFDRLFRILVVCVATPFLWAGGAMGQEQGTPEQAQAMAEAAAAYFQAEGAEAAFEAFNTGEQFHDRDLYVFAIDREGVMVAHGANQNLVGRNVLDMRDPNGVQLFHEFLAVEDAGWVDYQWPHPQTGAVQDKTSYIINVGEYAIGVGAYK